MKKLLLVCTWLVIISFIITAIVLWSGDEEFIGLEFFFFYVVPFCIWVAYKVMMFKLWIAFDIKTIRSKVCKENFSSYLEDFVPTYDDDDSDEKETEVQN